METNGVEPEIIGSYVNANLNLKAKLHCEVEQLAPWNQSRGISVRSGG
jgi:hypothetical protein